MKKIFAIFGISLMITGLACLSLLNFKINTKTEYVKVENSWTILPWNFSKGDIMSIAIWPGANNSWGPPSIGGEAITLPPGSNQTFSADMVKIFQIWITNPTGNWTVIEVYYITADPLKGPMPFSEYFGVDNHGALILDGGYPMPGEYKGKGAVVLGRAPQDGLYNITCSIDPPMVMDSEIIDSYPNATIITSYPNGTIISSYPNGTIRNTYPKGTIISSYPNGTIITSYPNGTIISSYPNGIIMTRRWPHSVSPPSMMWLLRTREETPSPYLLIPIGAPMFASGTIITILWGVKRKKKPHHHKIAEYKTHLNE
jgi:hypothetical protein